MTELIEYLPRGWKEPCGVTLRGDGSHESDLCARAGTVFVVFESAHGGQHRIYYCARHADRAISDSLAYVPAGARRIARGRIEVTR